MKQLYLFLLLCLPYMLYAQQAFEICGNGIDDDGNGLIDCEDPGAACEFLGFDCSEVNCSNSYDDDGDGLTDYYDNDCQAHCDKALTIEICENIVGTNEAKINLNEYYTELGISNEDSIIWYYDPGYENYIASVETATASNRSSFFAKIYNKDTVETAVLNYTIYSKPQAKNTTIATCDYGYVNLNDYDSLVNNNANIYWYHDFELTSPASFERIEHERAFFALIDNGKCSSAVPITFYPDHSFTYISNLPSTYCLKKDTIQLSAYPRGGTFTGKGITTINNEPFLVIEDAGIGKHTITYRVNENGCPSETSEEIRIYACDGLATNLQDSLSLVALYHATDGDNWRKNDNWLNGDVRSWFGINTLNGRVTGIDLEYNNLKGTVPAKITEMDSLQYVNLSYNYLTEVPDFTAIPTGLPEGLNIMHNQLTFKHIVPNTGVDSIVYAPQKIIFKSDTVVMRPVGSSYTIDADIDDEIINSTYKWSRKDNISKGTTNVNKLTLTNLSLDDSQTYQCTVTNPDASELTLYVSRIVDLKVYEPSVVSVSDSLALVALYHSTNGDSWKKNEGWLEVPVSSWFGVTVTNERVSELHLSDNNLQGSLPQQIGNLNQLSKLDFTLNEIGGELPTSIENLTQLRELKLSVNNFEGEFPKEVKALTELQILDIGANNFSGPIPAEIQYLTKLSRFSAYVSGLSGEIPKEFKYLSALTELNLAGNALEGRIPSELAQLTALYDIDLSGNKLRGELPNEFESLSNLYHLDLRDNKITKIPSGLDMLYNLDIYNNNLSFDDIIPYKSKGLMDFNYAPQAKVSKDTILSLNEAESYTINLEIDNKINDNQYVWHKDNQLYETTSTDSLTVNESGIYTCIITNPRVPDLELISGKYEVEARNNECEAWPDTQVITVEQLQPVSSCDPGTADGIARVLINGQVADESEYDIEWEDEQQAGVLAIGDTATNLKPILYNVTVTNKLTGCQDSETIDMTLDRPEMAPPVVTDNTSCDSPNGSITAQLLSGDTNDYHFMLLRPIVGDTLYSDNPSFDDLAADLYELRAYDPDTQCGLYSEGIEIEITEEISIDGLSVEVVNSQTACAPPYNGQLQAEIANPDMYDFVWYRGTVTSGPTAEIIANSAITPDTLSTNLTDIYTVVATRQNTGCTVSKQINLTEDIASAAFSYAHSSYCQSDNNPIPEVHITGGTFSSSPGLVFVDNNTGEIDLSASTSGNYTITYTHNSSCVKDNSFDVTIVPTEGATFFYTQNTYCQSDNNPLPTIMTSGGVFSSTSGLVFLDTNTGEIDLSESTPGTYMISYNTPWVCPRSSSEIIEIKPSAPATLIAPYFIGCNEFTVSWRDKEPFNSPDSYHIQVSEDERFNTVVYDTISYSNEWLRVSNLIAGRTYFFRVGSISDCMTAYTTDSVKLEGPLLEVTNVVASHITPNEFFIEWDTVEFAMDYHIEVDDDVSFTSPYMDMNHWANSIHVSGLDANTTYYIRLNAEYECGAGPSSTIEVSTGSSNSYSLTTDSLALVALYHATNGDNWTRNDNWLTGPLDTWYGVTVSEWNNRVSLLSLYNNNLSGSIPSEIGELTSLSFLWMPENQLEGEMPIELAQLTNLGQLNLSYNKLEGLIPKELEALEHLSNLGLSHNQFRGELPIEILNIFVNNNTEYDSLAIENNHLTKLPNYPSALDPSIMHFVQNNKLTFDDILPNIVYFDTYFGFSAYAPQQAIGVDTTLYFDEGESYTINLGIDEEISDNQYVWFKDDVAFDTTHVNHYTFSSLAIRNEGRYTCEVTNAGVPDLTLYSYPISIYVAPKNKDPKIIISKRENCVGENIPFLATGRNEYDTYHWEIIRMNGNTRIGIPDSMATAQTFDFSLTESGSYELRLRLSNPYISDTVLIDYIGVKASPQLSLEPSTNLNADSLMLTALDGYNADTLAFEWYKIEGQKHISLGYQNTIWIKEGGSYGVTVNNPTGCEAKAEILVIDTRLQAQTITFDSIADKVFGKSFQLMATASSGLPINFEVTEGKNLVNINGDELTILGTGKVSIQAKQEGDKEYAAAKAVTRSFTIHKATQTISVKQITDQLLSNRSFNLEASSSSGLALSFSVTGPISIRNKTVSLLGTGVASITASQAGNNNYLPAEAITLSFSISEEIVEEEDSLHQLSISIGSQGAAYLPAKLSLYRYQNGIYQLLSQESIYTSEVSYDNLAEGLYTIKVKSSNPIYLPTYLGQHLLLAEADKLNLNENKAVSISPISIPDILEEIGIRITGVFVQSDQVENGRLMLANKASGIPVVGLSIYLIDDSSQEVVAITTTDGDGRFEFKNIPPGSYSVKADHKGLAMGASASFEVGQQALELSLIAGSKIELTAEEKTPDMVTALDDEVKQQLRLFPNPVEKLLHIQLPQTLVGCRLVIFDTNGKQVYTSLASEKEVSCDLAHLSSGYYQLQLRHKGESYSLKFLKK
ncbi:T9SS type A sorting domain-containing protein [Porifericola rhodea]|uniref:T9SS type A sorting domain-containing protein n=1 Tax=Porifericola rhodea TaxID=930972 RepID=UPI0026651D82|nr:T9SS type A sorting domain-containing protein [Porifericola rhodea]WKN32901.1 T9SS type A sorting domain-containing protein [Porifericola rhodea]